MFVVHVVRNLVVHVPRKTHKPMSMRVRCGKLREVKSQQNIDECMKWLVAELCQITLPR